MRQTFCDHCKSIIDIPNIINANNTTYAPFNVSFDLCDDCFKKYVEARSKLDDEFFGETIKQIQNGK